MTAHMNVTVKYFAGIREAIGLGSESVNTSATTLQALRDALIARGGVYAEVLAQGRAVRMAFNQEVCDGDVTLTEGCEVAFFPPVTGG
jgi:molybdopterin synthase sulfur carrier subunit